MRVKDDLFIKTSVRFELMNCGSQTYIHASKQMLIVAYVFHLNHSP